MNIFLEISFAAFEQDDNNANPEHNLEKVSLDKLSETQKTKF